MKRSRNGRLSNQDRLNSQFLTIISEDENETSIIMPCNSTVVDDLGNTYRVEGSYYVDCKEPVSLRVLKEVKKWKSTKCCGQYPTPPSEYSGEFSGKREYKTAPDCGPCNKWHTAAYKCTYEDYNTTWQECEWMEGFSPKLVINDGEPIDASFSLEISPFLQTPLGFWKNDSGYIIKSASFPNLQGTNFNYSCSPLIEASGDNHYGFVDPISVDFMPSLATCKLLVKVPGKIVDAETDFCTSVQVVKDAESDAVGFMSALGDCAVKLLSPTNQVVYLWVSKDSFRFVKEVNNICCINSGDGFYTGCGSGTECGTIIPKIQSVAWSADVVIDERSTVGGSASAPAFSVSTPFSSLLSNSVSSILLIVGIIIAAIAVIIVTVIIIRCWCKSCAMTAVQNTISGGSCAPAPPPSTD
jgi:hypothetical protein